MANSSNAVKNINQDFWIALFEDNLIDDSVYEERKALLGLKGGESDEKNVADLPEQKSEEEAKMSIEFRKDLLDVLVKNSRQKPSFRTQNSGRYVPVTNANAGSAACCLQ